MSVLRLDANRTFDAAGPANAEANDDWFAAAAGFFERGNTVSIAGSTLGVEEMTFISEAATDAERQSRFAQFIGNRRADFEDFKRLLDDVMAAQPSVSSQDFALSQQEARRVGVIDAVQPRAYPARGRVVLETTSSVDLLARSISGASGMSSFAHSLFAAAMHGPAPALNDLFDRGARSPAESLAVEFRQWVNSSDFRRLPPPVREAAMQAVAANIGGDLGPVIAALRANPNDRLLSTGLQALGSEVFVALPDSVRSALQGAIITHAGRGGIQLTLGKLAESPAFAALDLEQQSLLVRYVGCGAPEISEGASMRLQNLLMSTAYVAMSNSEQAAALAGFVATDPPQSAGVLRDRVGGYDAVRLPYTMTGPTEVAAYAFESHQAPASEYIVTVGGQTIPVMMPNPPTSPDGTVLSIDVVAQGLAALPAESRALVTTVRVSDRANSQDPLWRVAYGWSESGRSFMTCGAAGLIDIYPSAPDNPQSQSSIDGSMIHETGHALSSQRWGALPQPPRDKELSPHSGWLRWQNAIAADGTTPSGYARSDMPEDFSESLRLLSAVRGTPEEAEVRALFPARFAILDELLAPTG